MSGKTKIKTHSGGKKRFRKSGNGKWMRKHSTMRHNTSKKGKSQKRRLSDFTQVSKADEKNVNRLFER